MLLGIPGTQTSSNILKVRPKVVLANGCFDVFHIGHLLYLQAAAKLGDRLVVSITRNRSVNKGPDRPTYDERARVRVVKSLRCVDQVLLVDDTLEAFKKIKPDIFCKGADYKGKIRQKDIDYCREHKIEIVITKTPLYDRSGRR